MPAKKTTKRTTPKRASSGFTAAEKQAMKDRAREAKAARGRGKDLEPDVLAAIAKMPEPDRDMATRLHALVKATAPDLAPRTWYGMPAYARDGKVVCFFQAASKFDAKYATFGFSDEANLGSGAMWPTAYALTTLGPAEERKLATLVKRAARR